MSKNNFDKRSQQNRRPGNHELESRLTSRSNYRSQGERKIAQLLNQYGIPFIYEKPTAVRDAEKTKIWYPDFYLFCGVYIEYFGITNNQEYRERTQHKLSVYARNGMNVIPVYPQDLQNGWQQRILGRIDRSLEKILYTYRQRSGTQHISTSTSISRQYAKLR